MNSFLFVIYGVVGPILIVSIVWLVMDYIKDHKAAAK